jgi:hypothetical protein
MTTTDTPTDPAGKRPRRLHRNTRILLLALAALVALVIVSVVVVPLLHKGSGPGAAAAAATSAPSAEPASTRPVPIAESAAAVAALPEVRYNAVISGLLPVDQEVAVSTPGVVFHLSADAPLYGADPTDPVARFAAKDFLGVATTVVGVERLGAWERVLTPARMILPSKAPAGEVASAQTSAWVPSSYLTQVATPTQRVVISTEKQTIAIVDASGATVKSFPAAIGTPKTPTPTGVTGYLEERYVDASQGTGSYPIQLTSLHSSAADEPYGGSDGGLIGVHYYSDHSGAVSHGCVRLGGPALDAINALPLGTLVTVR